MKLLHNLFWLVYCYGRAYYSYTFLLYLVQMIAYADTGISPYIAEFSPLYKAKRKNLKIFKKSACISLDAVVR